MGGEIPVKNRNGKEMITIGTDPMMTEKEINKFIKEATDIWDEESDIYTTGDLGKKDAMSNTVAYHLLNRSGNPAAIPDDDPLPGADGKFHWKHVNGNIDRENARFRGHFPPGVARSMVNATGME